MGSMGGMSLRRSHAVRMRRNRTGWRIRVHTRDAGDRQARGMALCRWSIYDMHHGHFSKGIARGERYIEGYVVGIVCDGSSCYNFAAHLPSVPKFIPLSTPVCLPSASLPSEQLALLQLYDPEVRRSTSRSSGSKTAQIQRHALCPDV